MDIKIKCEFCGQMVEAHKISNYKFYFNEMDICDDCAKSINFKNLQELYKNKKFEEEVIDSELMISELEHDNFISESDYYWNANVHYLSKRVRRLLSRLQ